MEGNHSTLQETIVLDFGAGSIERVETYWADSPNHSSHRWIVHSRRAIIADILEHKPANINIIASDCFWIKSKESFLLAGLPIEVVPVTEKIPDILLACNPAPGILNESSPYAGYIPGLLKVAKRMKKWSHIFIQLDRAFIESFPDTDRDSHDDQIFWERVSPALSETGFTLAHDNYMLGLTLDRFWPFESKLFCKTLDIEKN